MREGDMQDVHLRLFCERLKRVLAGKEGALPLPDSTNLTPLFKNLLTETEIITTLLGNYEGDMARHLIQLIGYEFDEDELPLPFRQFLDVDESDEDVKRLDILENLVDINHFVHESEEAIDTFFINIMQQQNSESESTTCKALLIGLHGKIIAIRNQMQQLPPRYNDFDISEQSDKLIRLLIERQHQLDIKEFERGREELFDLLIEGHPRLAVVAILDSSAFDKLLLLQILTIIITSSSILTVMLGSGFLYSTILAR
ncbi:hypothetical protein CUMW_251220 [Citrus unshiu]|uniref:Uncharacterized protein n=1 Tax=Citrus unshiu TaxID=55188 RepID=A0A2H5QQ57_CITUN|nr:hypothetical protein CUMW_251220 [Citrus unshiu]